MISAILADGISVFSHSGNAARRVLDAGVSRELFIRTMLVAAAFAAVEMFVPEINGVSAAMDKVTGTSPDDFSLLAWPGFATLIVVIAAPIMFVLWRGPAVAAWLAARLGGQGGLQAAAVWIYLATAASIVVSIAVTAGDVIAGVILVASQSVAGWFAWTVALVGLLAILSSSSALARTLFAITTPARSLTMTIIWLLMLLSIGLTASFPLLAWA
jgi:hypothetical protein